MPTGNVSVVDTVIESSVARVYDCYAGLRGAAAAMGLADLAHRLVLLQPLSAGGGAPVMAASIASAASLTIEPSTMAVRHAIRNGTIDFTVNSLDEALRAIKNEIRKGLSIAVCLEGEPAPVLKEMVERGVQPDLVCGWGAADAGVDAFLKRGAVLLKSEPVQRDETLIDTTWKVSLLPGQFLPRVDEVVSTLVPDEDTVRQQWLRRAPRYLGRALRTERFLPLRAGEKERLVFAVRERMVREQWEAEVMVCHGGVIEKLARPRENAG